MEEWLRKRIKEYPELTNLIFLFTNTQSLTNDDKFVLETLERMTRKLYWGRELVAKKTPSSRRTKATRTRIKVGLTYWLAENDGIKVEEACLKYKLVSKNTYYQYKKEGLIYYDMDIFLLGGALDKLAKVFKEEGKPALEARIGELVARKIYLDDVQKQSW